MNKIDERIEAKLNKVNTVSLGKITEVDNPRFRCNLMLKNRVQSNEIELFDVPVACLRSGVGTIYVPLNVGDIVLVLFSKYELDEQLKDRQVVDVNQVLKFDLNNAVVLGGVFTQADGIPSIQEDKINLIGDVHVSGDLTFNTIDGTPIEDGSWHSH